MIIVKLQGGLGNQMFQYAAGRQLATLNNTELILDLSFLHRRKQVNYTIRNFELGVFHLLAKHHNFFWSNRIARPLLKKIYKIKYIAEPTFAFDPEILLKKGNIYLDGFWQCEKYFSNIGAAIRDDFKFSKEPEIKVKTIAEEIQKINSVSVHIRRGDYVDKRAVTTYVDLFSDGYYKKAFDHFGQILSDPVYYIFSDDLKWVEDNLDMPKHYRIVDYSNYEDLWLMSLCKHQIIANSSFSWWGAWLNTNPEKVVIAPKHWFLDSTIKTDIIPEGWYQI